MRHAEQTRDSVLGCRMHRQKLAPALPGQVCSLDVEMGIGVAMHIMAPFSVVQVASKSNIGPPQVVFCGVEIRVIFNSE